MYLSGAYLGAYLLWRYSYLIDYGYKAYYYGSYLYSWGKTPTPVKGTGEDEDWVLCDLEDSFLTHE